MVIDKLRLNPATISTNRLRKLERRIPRTSQRLLSTIFRGTIRPILDRDVIVAPEVFHQALGFQISSIRRLIELKRASSVPTVFSCSTEINPSGDNPSRRKQISLLKGGQASVKLFYLKAIASGKLFFPTPAEQDEAMAVIRALENVDELREAAAAALVKLGASPLLGSESRQWPFTDAIRIVLAEWDRLQGQFAQKSAEVKAAGQQIGQLEESLRQANARIEELGSQKELGLEAAKEQIAQLTSDLQAATETIQQLERGIDKETELRAELSAAKKRLSTQFRNLVTNKLETFDGRYIHVSTLGEGGMATALLIFDTKEKDKKKQFKVFKIPLQKWLSDKNIIERFRREASSMASLKGIEGFVQSFEAEDGRGVPRMSKETFRKLFGATVKDDLPDEINYIEMEYIDSPTLTTFLRESDPHTDQGMQERKALSIAVEIARSLNLVPEGMVHRDLKPDNIFITPQGEVKIADFGLTKFTTDQYTMMNQPGLVMGTAPYMSPEQFLYAGQTLTTDSRGTDWRTDQYALGIILYEMISGRTPFDDFNINPDVNYKNIMAAPLPKISGLNPKIWLILEKMLAKNRDDRFNNWEECISALEEVIK